MALHFDFFTGVKNQYEDEDRYGFYFINKETGEEVKLATQEESEAFAQIESEGWEYVWTDAGATRHFFKKLRN